RAGGRPAPVGAGVLASGLPTFSRLPSHVPDRRRPYSLAAAMGARDSGPSHLPRAPGPAGTRAACRPGPAAGGRRELRAVSIATYPPRRPTVVAAAPDVRDG